MTIKADKPQRTCVGCKKRYDQDELLAITRLKNGEVVVNDGHKKAGRSVYLCRKAECLRKARDRKGQNGLQFGLKVQIPDSVWENLEKLLK